MILFKYFNFEFVLAGLGKGQKGRIKIGIFISIFGTYTTMRGNKFLTIRLRLKELIIMILYVMQ